MNVEDTVRTLMLEYPTLFKNALDAYVHLFCTIGNGFQWENGELVDVCTKYPKEGINLEQATKRIFSRKRLEDISSLVKTECIMHNIKDFDEEGVQTIVKSIIDEVTNRLQCQVLLNNDIEKRMKDFEPYDRFDGKYKKYKDPFYVSISNIEKLCGNESPYRKWVFNASMCIEYSYICNIPNNVKPDWLIAIDKMLWFISTHKDCWDYNHKTEEYRALILAAGFEKIKDITDKWENGWYINGCYQAADLSKLNVWKARNKKTSYFYGVIQYGQH